MILNTYTKLISKLKTLLKKHIDIGWYIGYIHWVILQMSADMCPKQYKCFFNACCAWSTNDILRDILIVSGMYLKQWSKLKLKKFGLIES